MTVLIVAEKPKVAEKIASAIGSAKKRTNNQAAYYEVDNGEIIVAPSVGHVFSLKEKNENSWNVKFPVFDVEWVPIYNVSKKSDYTKGYIKNLEDLSKKCDEFVNACDYDREGSVIGYNILVHACNVNPKKGKIKRMHFSTVTLPELKNAYQNLEDFDEGQTKAGITRHVLDWYYGINLSRALNSAMGSKGGKTTLSIGRVQGPALKLVVDKEKEIKAFKPEPYWTISSIMDKKGEFEAIHETEKFWEEDGANNAYGRCKDAKKGTVKGVEKKKFNQSPPNPFDLTTLQIEAYRHHRIDPKKTLDLAQSLYESGLISYPRTSSQQLPPTIGYRKIIESLSKQSMYSEIGKLLLKESALKPNNGKKTDPAHPAIYPTGEIPKDINVMEEKLYSLIVHRFFATFGKDAVRETVRAVIIVNNEPFIAKGKSTLEKNWHVLYGKYAVFDEVTLPVLHENETVDVKKIELEKKETQPPKRYTQASIISELEKRDLGTKATRAGIIDTLYRRGYVTGKSLEATNLGISIVETLEKHVEQILDEKLTRDFESKMEEIEKGNVNEEEVKESAIKIITSVSEKFKKEEAEIGEELRKALKITRTDMDSIGECPRCGHNVVVRKNPATKKRFVGCSNYPNCTFTQPLPQKGTIKPLRKNCPKCNYPMVNVWTKGKKVPWALCININCK